MQTTANDEIKIRTATPEDAEALAAIYAPYVENTSIAFEYTVPSVKEFAERIRHTLARYPYLVAEKSGTLSQSFTYVGTTQWLDEQRGLARVEVNFTDDLVALRAFKDALCAINEAVVL